MNPGTLALAVDGRCSGLLHDGADEPAAHVPRPFLHPVSTPGGQDVSDYRPADHPWHWGLSIAVAGISVDGQEHPVNLWGGPTYRDGQGYVDLPNNGSQRIRSWRRDGEDSVHLELDWCAADGAPFLAEERSWHVASLMAAGAEWFTTTVRSTWTNTSGGRLSFGSPTTAGRPGAGYGGFFLRLPPSFDGAAILAGGAGGVSPGESELMGQTRPWLGLSSDSASVLMVPAAGNPSGASPWFVRSTGTPMLCAAPFFHEEMHLQPAGTLEWTWSLLATDGPARPEACAEAAGILGNG